MKLKTLPINIFLLVFFFSFTLKAQKSASGELKQATPESVGLSSQKLTNIDNLFNKFIEDKIIPGGIVLIGRKGKIVYHKTFGNRDLDTKQPFQKGDIFRIASMTKAITTTAMLQLYEKGLFGLDDPLHLYLPQFKDPMVLNEFNTADSTYTSTKSSKQITIRHLLSHTSGISYGFMDPRINAIYAKNGGAHNFGLSHPVYSTKDMINIIAKQPLLHEPGEKWSYGLNCEVLGYLVEVFSGQTLGEYCRKNIFDPLGMDDTWFYLPKEKEDKLVPVYAYTFKDGLNKIPAPQNEMLDYPKKGPLNHFAGGGGLSATAKDYGIFCQAMLNDGVYNGKRILGRKTIELMTSDQLAKMGVKPYIFGDIDNGTSFGLGYAIQTEKYISHAHGSVGNFYWSGAFHTKFWINPEEDMFMVTMVQLIPFERPDLFTKLNTIIYSAIDD